MTLRRFVIAAALVGLTASRGAAAVESPEERAHNIGLLTGSATFCGVALEDMAPLAQKMLRAAKVDPYVHSPALDRFLAGVSEGTREMNTESSMSCDRVKKVYTDMKARYGG